MRNMSRISETIPTVLVEQCTHFPYKQENIKKLPNDDLRQFYPDEAVRVNTPGQWQLLELDVQEVHEAR